jgi:hypothetical protein
LPFLCSLIQNPATTSDVWPHNFENKKCETDPPGKFSENNKLQNTRNEYETPKSTYQNETLAVLDKNGNKFIVGAFPRKVRKILVQYEKLNSGDPIPI